MTKYLYKSKGYDKKTKIEGTLNSYKPLWKSCRKQELSPVEYCKEI